MEDAGQITRDAEAKLAEKIAIKDRLEKITKEKAWRDYSRPQFSPGSKWPKFGASWQIYYGASIRAREDVEIARKDLSTSRQTEKEVRARIESNIIDLQGKAGQIGCDQ